MNNIRRGQIVTVKKKLETVLNAIEVLAEDEHDFVGSIPESMTNRIGRYEEAASALDDAVACVAEAIERLDAAMNC